MGPFGTMVILPMFPELREAFGVSSGAVGWGCTVYFLPFAGLLVVSGTLGERWGRRRTVRGTLLLYAAASLVCAVAPNLTVFLVGRALQGVANAFITPLLLAALAELVPEARFGRTVGIYGMFQAFGGGIAPVVGGLAAEVDWRWAFVGAAALATTLAIWPPPGEPRRARAAPPIRPLFTRRMVVLGLAALAAAIGPIGAAVIVGVAARDELGRVSCWAPLGSVAGPLGSATVSAVRNSFGVGDGRRIGCCHDQHGVDRRLVGDRRHVDRLRRDHSPGRRGCLGPGQLRRGSLGHPCIPLFGARAGTRDLAARR